MFNTRDKNNGIMLDENLKYRKERLNAKDEITDECCDDPKIEMDNGLSVCRNCGVVTGERYSVEERRSYTAIEVEKRQRTEKRWREIGPRTVLPTSNIDSRGKYMKSNVKVKFRRLAKIQNSLVSSMERNFWEAKPKLKLFASKLNLPDHIRETGWRIYKKCPEKKLTMGRSIDAFLAASLYASIRIHEFPRLLEEVSSASNVVRRTLHQALALVVREVLSEMNLKYKPITPDVLIYRFSNDLFLSMEIQKMAIDVYDYARINGLSSVGKDPKGIAIACIYIICKKFQGIQNMTQSKLSEVAKITEVTLRARVKEIMKIL